MQLFKIYLRYFVLLLYIYKFLCTEKKLLLLLLLLLCINLTKYHLSNH
jgi:hypothetical protein